MFTGRRYLAQNPARLCSVIGNADFLDAIDVGDFIEDFFLVGIKREEGEVLGIEDAQNFLVQVEENMV